MHYTQLFRTLREAKGLTLEELSRQARRHRNTVVNVESGRPVKFKTIAELMVKMGYASTSPEMTTMALLWLEDLTDLPFSRSETQATAQKAINSYGAGARQATKRLHDAITRHNFGAAQIDLLVFAAQHPPVMAILESVREFKMNPKDVITELKVAEEK